jgi:hypothetical protein
MQETIVTHPLAKYRNHLEFNGYKIEEEEENWLLSRHSRKFDLYLKKIEERGVLVSTAYHIQENISKVNLLEFANDLNAEFLFMKAYLSDDGVMMIETFFEGDYDRTNFSILLDNIEFDMNTFFQHDLTEAYLQ